MLVRCGALAMHLQMPQVNQTAAARRWLIMAHGDTVTDLNSHAAAYSAQFKPLPSCRGNKWWVGGGDAHCSVS